MIAIVLPTINCSVQVGDIVYFLNENIPTQVGTVTVVGNGYLTIDENNPTGGQAPLLGDYILFAKNHAINTSSLVGYFADVKFENNSTEKIELFSVGSEITESSK